MAANDLTERQKMLLTLAVGIVLNAGLGIWLYSVLSTYNAKEKSYAELQKTRDKLKQDVESEPRLASELERKKKELNEKQRKLPNANDVAALSVDMSTLAQEAGVTYRGGTFVKDISQGGAPGASYERNVCNSKWSADLYSWCKFINKMEEDFKRFISFENLTIKPKSDSGLTGVQHEISVDIVAYKYVPRP